MRLPHRRAPAAPVSALILLPVNGAQAAPSSGTGLGWKPCPVDGDTSCMECAALEVPVNWDRPDGRPLTLQLGRLRSTGPKPARGSLLIAYGGPGGPGITITRQTAAQWAGPRARMDLVTWDTRGYGKQFGGTSTGLDCVWTRVPVPNLAPGRRGVRPAGAHHWANTYPCRTRDPELFDHMSSADHAKDMEAIRQALREPKLTFYGASYAGFYAQAYARLYPGRVRAMVLDGTFAHATADWDAELVAHARRNERAMRRFFDWCDASESCVLRGRDVRRAWRKLVVKADSAPIPGQQDGIGYHYDGADLRGLGLGLARQGEASWPLLTQAIRDALRGDATGFVPDRPQGPYVDLPTGITECLDLPRFSSYEQQRKTIARLERIAPSSGAVGTMATNTPQCVGWPTKVTNPPAPLPNGVPQLLGAGAWGRVRRRRAGARAGARERLDPPRRRGTHAVAVQRLRACAHRPVRHGPRPACPPNRVLGAKPGPAADP